MGDVTSLGRDETEVIVEGKQVTVGYSVNLSQTLQ